MSGERIARHNQLRDALYAAAASANLAPLRELRALIPESDSRPADVLIPRYTNGKDTCIDVTVINSCRLDLLQRSSEIAGFALNHVFNAKWTKHGPACERAGMIFLPLAFDTFGAVHPQGADFLKKLGKTIARATAQDESECVNHLFQRLSMLLVKGNVNLLLNRRPEL